MTPTDADFDDMHHALGRPDGPHVQPYRNYYCVGSDTPTAERFMALGLWERSGSLNGGRDAYFAVTDEGRRLLMVWLAERQRKAGVRPYLVTGRGLSARTILAKSPAAARYRAYLDVSDVHQFDDGFLGFLRLDVRAVIV